MGWSFWGFTVPSPFNKVKSIKLFHCKKREKEKRKSSTVCVNTSKNLVTRSKHIKKKKELSFFWGLVCVMSLLKTIFMWGSTQLSILKNKALLTSKNYLPIKILCHQTRWYWCSSKKKKPGGKILMHWRKWAMFTWKLLHTNASF